MKSAARSLRQVLPSLHSLALFEAAARSLNFSKAAEDLSITQPAVSHGVRQLEAALGTPLFFRERRALVLTPDGERLFAAVSQGLTAISEAIEDIRGRAEGRQDIVLSLSTSMAACWLFPRLAILRQTLPHIGLRLRTTLRDSDLVQEGIGFEIRLGDGRWPQVDSVPLWPEEIYAVRAGGADDVDPFDGLGSLVEAGLIHYDDPLRLRLDWREWLQASGFSGLLPPPVVRVNDHLVGLQGAMSGQGIALGWRPIIDDALKTGALRLAYRDPVLTGRHFFLVNPKGMRLRKSSLEFRDWIMAQAKARPSIV